MLRGKQNWGPISQRDDKFVHLQATEEVKKEKKFNFINSFIMKNYNKKNCKKCS